MLLVRQEVFSLPVNYLWLSRISRKCCPVLRPSSSSSSSRLSADGRMLLTEKSSSQMIQAVLTSAPTGLEGFKAHAVFQEIAKKLQEEGEQFVKKIGGVFAFKVKDGPGGSEALWFVDVKEGRGCVHNDASEFQFNAVYSFQNIIGIQLSQCSTIHSFIFIHIHILLFSKEISKLF
uniref:SCP2 domain-containing protein n=1 Tax=Astyanax mexicanus TaxID=7994 RepID=A0A8B9GKS7_ASTMX